MIGIYKIENLLNGKVYIGQSINIEERWKQHKYKAFNTNEVGYNSAIHQAFRKYGLENFSFSIVEETSIDQLDEKEKYWINHYNSYNNGYNCTIGGQKNKISDDKRYFCIECGTLLSQKTKTGLCRNCYNKKNREHIPAKDVLIQQLFDNNGNFSAVGRLYNRTDNAVVKWCKNYGISHYSSDYKQKIDKKSHKIPVVQIDQETGEIIAEYESAMAAARAFGKSRGSHITEVCKGKNKTAYGFIWKYKT